MNVLTQAYYYETLECKIFFSQINGQALCAPTNLLCYCNVLFLCWEERLWPKSSN